MGLWEQAESAKIRAMYTAYFDESGDIKSEKFLAIAGFVAKDETWAAFDQAWNAALKKHGAPPLHTTDLMNYKREFKNWNREREDPFVKDLIDAIQDAGRIVRIPAHREHSFRFNVNTDSGHREHGFRPS